MKKKSIALLFPGQGSQYVGMGQELSPCPLFDQADQILNKPLSQIMLTGPEEKLKLTTYTQPAILTHSLALFEQLQNQLIRELEEAQKVEISWVLGHSVGEYGALVAPKPLVLPTPFGPFNCAANLWKKKSPQTRER